MNTLLNKYLEGSISDLEREVLKSWVLESSENENIFKAELLAYDAQYDNEFDVEVAFERFSQSTFQKQPKSKVIRLTTFYKYAAVFIVLIAMGFFIKSYLKTDLNSPENQMVAVPSESKSEEIVIKLSDGSTQILHEDGDSGIVDAQGNQIASKKENTIRFEKSENSNPALVYNEISIPNGKKLKLILSDGSEVMLNGGSRFRFPNQFIASSGSRKVFLTGEAFFDIAKNKSFPFIVNAGEIDISVLGTRFNVSAYDTDKTIATTLVEGSVSVHADLAREKYSILSPSEQLRYDNKAKTVIKKLVDTSIYTAWIQNKLIINSLSFEEILRKLERRDDVVIINKASNLNKEVFKGEFTNESAESILNVMSLSTPFDYRINGSTITITNK